MKRIDRTGQKYGRLTVDSYAHTDRGRSYWGCICDCGEEVVVSGSHLQSGRTKSCGCLKKDVHTKHGHASRENEHPLYETWANMHRRCENSFDSHYKDYGARGIRVCGRWDDLDSFAEDMGPKPNGTSLDRIDNDGPYSPENCKWSTSTEQNRNRRGVKLTIEDARVIRQMYPSMLQVEIAEKYGVSRRTVGFILSGERWAE